MPRQWPDPLLQPDRHEGCFLYREHKWEGMFPVVRFGAKIERHWNYEDDRDEWRRYWLGSGTRPWVEDHLARNQISVVIVERVSAMAHALVLLESRDDDGVFVMDPLYGHCTESWDWFLSIGPGNHGCHHIDGWFSLH